MTTLEQIRADIAKAASDAAGIDIAADVLELSNPKAGSHLALPCFRFAGSLGKSPVEIAEMIAGSIDTNHLSQVTATGPYVNFWLESLELASLVNSEKISALSDTPPNGKTAVFDILAPNLAKPLSIGHLRNALQGKALAINYRNAGYNVITDNHIGDWGTVFGMWVVGFEQFSSEEQLVKDGVRELGHMYVQVRNALKAEEELGQDSLKNLVQDWLVRLEDGDEEAWEYHAKFSEISLREVTEQVAEIGLVFDHNLGESFYIERAKEMVEEMVESGDAIRNDDGSVIVPLEGQGIDTPMLIEKSNGTALYATSDIATIEYRAKTWNPDVIIYVVGAEQQFHFKQVFAANEKVGWSDAKLIHHWYGLIEELDEDGNRSKMSSRKSAVYMADLLDMASEKARLSAPDDLSDEDIKRISQGALTFREFSANHKGNTLFDWDSMFSLSGFSGPYVQYAAVRIASIVGKSEQSAGTMPEGYDWADHAGILWHLSRFTEVVDGALVDREFHKIAEYAYELAKMWNKFYEDNQVIGSGDDEPARLWLASAIYEYLERSLYLIGVEIPSKM